MSQSSSILRKRNRSRSLSPPDISKLVRSTTNHLCTLRFKGTRVDSINWAEDPPEFPPVEKTVLEHQDYNCCWASVSQSLSHSAFQSAGQKLATFSTQLLLDFVYPPGTELGHLSVGLEYIKKHGAMLENNYRRPFTGEVPRRRPKPPKGKRYKIHDWFPVDDDEEKIIAVLKAKHTVGVSVPNFTAFDNYKGDGLLDMSEAERLHIETWPDNKPYKAPEHHSLLIVGYGSCSLTDPGVKGLTVDYWVIKNVWGRAWGKEGYGYIIRHSSLIKIHKCVTDEEKEEVRSEFYPLYALVGDEANPVIKNFFEESEKSSFLSLIQKISAEEYRDYTLLCMLYEDSGYGKKEHPALEVFRALGKIYHNDKAAEVHMINVKNCKQEACAEFNLEEDMKVSLFVCLPALDGSSRSGSSCHRFKGVFRLAQILKWIEKLEPLR